MGTHNIPFSMSKKKVSLNNPKSAAMGFFPGAENELETVIVNELSVFEPLKVCCTLLGAVIYSFNQI